jgi:hypothetical protein
MDVSPKLRERLVGLAPWSGLIAAAIAYAMQHQVVSDALHFDCHAFAGLADLLLGAFALGLVGIGALLSLRASPADDEAPSMRLFIVRLSLMAAGLAALGIAWLMLAGVLLPGCRPA